MNELNSYAHIVIKTRINKKVEKFHLWYELDGLHSDDVDFGEELCVVMDLFLGEYHHLLANETQYIDILAPLISLFSTSFPGYKFSLSGEKFDEVFTFSFELSPRKAKIKVTGIENSPERLYYLAERNSQAKNKRFIRKHIDPSVWFADEGLLKYA